MQPFGATWRRLKWTDCLQSVHLSRRCYRGGGTATLHTGDTGDTSDTNARRAAPPRVISGPQFAPVCHEDQLRAHRRRPLVWPPILRGQFRPLSPTFQPVFAARGPPVGAPHPVPAEGRPQLVWQHLHCALLLGRAQRTTPSRCRMCKCAAQLEGKGAQRFVLASAQHSCPSVEFCSQSHSLAVLQSRSSRLS